MTPCIILSSIYISSVDSNADGISGNINDVSIGVSKLL
jgi:hypothetical protein